MVELAKCWAFCPKVAECKYAKQLEDWLLVGRLPTDQNKPTQRDYVIQAFIIYDVYTSDLMLADILAGRLTRRIK